MLEHHPSARILNHGSRHDSMISETSPGLPSEQFAALVARQKLENLFPSLRSRDSVGISSSASQCSALRDDKSRSSQLTCEQRLLASELRHATRKALGPSFDFDDKSDSGARSRDGDLDWNSQVDDGAPIPQKYIDEFNKRWHEDDEDRDADRMIADYTRKAAWRKHESIHSKNKQQTGYDVTDMLKHAEEYRQEFSHPGRSAENQLHQELPQTASKFSFDSDSDNDAEDDVEHLASRTSRLRLSRQSTKKSSKREGPLSPRKSLTGSVARKISNAR